jgi:hypothetical protein
MGRRVATLLIVLAVAVLTGCQKQRTPNWIEIPAGYRGYVVVEFSNPSCPALERRGEFEVIRFADDGRACASNRYEEQEGVATDRYFYSHPDGRLTELTYQNVKFGSMSGTVSPAVRPPLRRMWGSVFAPPGGNATVNYAIQNCAWSDAACWLPLRVIEP